MTGLLIVLVILAVALAPRQVTQTRAWLARRWLRKLTPSALVVSDDTMDRIQHLIERAEVVEWVDEQQAAVRREMGL